MMERMTEEEFYSKEAEILERLPEELRPTISYMAYERGHAYGYEEVLGYVQSLVVDLEKPLYEYAARIRSSCQCSERG